MKVYDLGSEFLERLVNLKWEVGEAMAYGGTQNGTESQVIKYFRSGGP
jgi:hypothetical protein